MADSAVTSPEQDSNSLASSYNDVAYASYPDAARHPDRLATIGTLLGLDVAPVATCRVLELACGDGLNLLPIAATLPRATFTGFDFAARPVERGQRMASDLRLDHVRLLQLDLRDVPVDLGSFDYIFAHGLYSWVPADVRARVLPLIARHLSAQGVAFVSYNTLPGCHMRRAVWEMLKYHTRDLADMPAKLAAARALLSLAATPVVGESTSQIAQRAEVRDAAERRDAALAHDDMSEPNDPVYFHEFMADATRAGLAFMAEARLATMMGGGLAPEVRKALGTMDRLTREQYLDFVYFRRYRETLLCHSSVQSRFVVQPARALGLHAVASSSLRRVPPAPASPTDDDVDAIKQYLVARWPHSVPVSELAEWRRRRTAPESEGQAPQATAQLIVELYVAGLVELRTLPTAAVAVAGERPEVFAAARRINREHEVIPNLYNEPLRQPDRLVQELLELLDGTRTRDELITAMGGAFAAPGGRAQLDQLLATFAGKALLVA